MKKRQRYWKNACKVALEKGLPQPVSWKEVWSLIETHGEPEWVYFIGPFDDPSVVKIGKSVNPRQRLRTLQTSYPTQLCLHYQSCNIKEKDIHNKFNHLRLHGEWFKFEQEIRDYLALLP